MNEFETWEKDVEFNWILANYSQNTIKCERCGADGLITYWIPFVNWHSECKTSNRTFREVTPSVKK